MEAPLADSRDACLKRLGALWQAALIQLEVVEAMLPRQKPLENDLERLERRYLTELHRMQSNKSVKTPLSRRPPRHAMVRQ